MGRLHRDRPPHRRQPDADSITLVNGTGQRGRRRRISHATCSPAPNGARQAADNPARSGMSLGCPSSSPASRPARSRQRLRRRRI